MSKRIAGRRVLPFTLLGALMAPAAMAGEADDRLYVTPMLSYVLADDARLSEDGVGGALALGKRMGAHLELELRAQYLQYDGETQPGTPLCGLLGTCPKGEDVDLFAGGLGLNLFLMPWDGGPYLHADAMAGDSTLYNIGLGYDFGRGGSVSLRAEALYHIDDDADVEEAQFNLGLRIPFGKREVAVAPLPEPVTVVPVMPMPAPPPPPPCELPPDGTPVTLEGCKAGDRFVLHGVNFEFNQSRLTANARTLLDQVASALLLRPDIDVEIQGHTDSKGSERYNQSLSERRAQSVLEYLVSAGVSANRMTARGFGEIQPISDNLTDEGRERNRRVELKVLAEGEAMKAEDGSTPEPAAPPAPAPATELEPQMDPETDPEMAPPPGALSEDLLEPSPEPEPAARAAPAASGTAAVTIVDMMFEPAILTITPGTTVTWTNNDGSNHIIEFSGEKSARMKMGATYSKRFDQPGTYDYLCAIHGAMMSGTVIVAAP